MQGSTVIVTERMLTCASQLTQPLFLINPALAARCLHSATLSSFSSLMQLIDCRGTASDLQMFCHNPQSLLLGLGFTLGNRLKLG